jgi:hypothetical protein
MNNPAFPTPNSNSNLTPGPAPFFQQDERLAYSVKVGELVAKGLRGEELQVEMRKWMAERRAQEQVRSKF